MSCENLSKLLANHADSLPQNSLDRIIALNLAEKLEMECKEFFSSMSATVNRSLSAAGAPTDVAKKFAVRHRKEAEVQALKLVVQSD